MELGVSIISPDSTLVRKEEVTGSNPVVGYRKLLWKRKDLNEIQNERRTI